MEKPNLNLPFMDDQVRALDVQIMTITDWVREQAAHELAEYGKHFTPLNDGAMSNLALIVYGKPDLVVEPTAEMTRKAMEAKANLDNKIDAILQSGNIGEYVSNKIRDALASEAMAAERNKSAVAAPANGNAPGQTVGDCASSGRLLPDKDGRVVSGIG